MADQRWPRRVVGLMLLAVTLQLVLSPLAGSSSVVFLVRSAGLIGMALLVTCVEVSRRRVQASDSELLAGERAGRAEAEAASRSKEEFFATLSHELRGPLNTIIAWIHLVRAGKLDEATAVRALETIERNAKSQAHLINDLLDVSRISGGNVRLDLHPVALAAIIEQAADSVRPAADERGVAVDVQSAPAVGTVAGDADRLQQVVVNLFSNAIKFTPRGGRITVRVAYDESHATISMRDTGQGIRPDFLPYLFDRFRQGDGIAGRSGGLGLGLTIVRGLVERHGGTVSAQRDGEGQGANFTVTLPIAAG